MTPKESLAIKFTPIKRDFYKKDMSPIYREVEAEKTKQISSSVQQTYKATQDTHKSGHGAKATFYADEPKYDINVELPDEFRRFKSHKRNLDGEVSSVIRFDENIERDRVRQQVTIQPFCEPETQPDVPKFVPTIATPTQDV